MLDVVRVLTVDGDDGRLRPIDTSEARYFGTGGITSGQKVENRRTTGPQRDVPRSSNLLNFQTGSLSLQPSFRPATTAAVESRAPPHHETVKCALVRRR